MPEPRRAAWAQAAVCALAAAALLVGAGCAAPSPGRVDYRARHEHMLDLVVERPMRMEAQRAERARRAALDDRADWTIVNARVDVYRARLAERRRRSMEAFERMLARQRTLREHEDARRFERWASFSERGAALQP